LRVDAARTAVAARHNETEACGLKAARRRGANSGANIHTVVTRLSTASDAALKVGRSRTVTGVGLATFG